MSTQEFLNELYALSIPLLKNELLDLKSKAETFCILSSFATHLSKDDLKEIDRVVYEPIARSLIVHALKTLMLTESPIIYLDDFVFSLVELSLNGISPEAMGLSENDSKSAVKVILQVLRSNLTNGLQLVSNGLTYTFKVKNDN